MGSRPLNLLLPSRLLWIRNRKAITFSDGIILFSRLVVAIACYLRRSTSASGKLLLLQHSSGPMLTALSPLATALPTCPAAFPTTVALSVLSGSCRP